MAKIYILSKYKILSLELCDPVCEFIMEDLIHNYKLNNTFVFTDKNEAENFFIENESIKYFYTLSLEKTFSKTS